MGPTRGFEHLPKLGLLLCRIELRDDQEVCADRSRCWRGFHAEPNLADPVVHIPSADDHVESKALLRPMRPDLKGVGGYFSRYDGSPQTQPTWRSTPLRLPANETVFNVAVTPSSAAKAPKSENHWLCGLNE